MIVPPDLPPDLATPALVIDPDVLERNLVRMQSALGDRGVRLRPHAKTHKSLVIARRQVELGAAGITVGTIGEAEVMAAGGIEDIFIAYPLWAAGDAGRRLRELNDVVRLAVGIDSTEAVAPLAEASRGSRPLEVMVEVDSGEGRTGVTDPDAACEIARMALAAGLRVRGAFTHGGHGYRLGQRGAAADDELRVLADAARAMAAAGVDVEELSAGSTPTALLSAREPVTEERPGTYALGDRQQLHLGAIEADGLALWVAATVVSTAVPGQFVINAGAKTLARDLPPFLDGYGVLPAHGNAVVARMYDYHGVVELPEGARAPALGTMVAVVPNHACPVVNLGESLAVVRGGRLVDRWSVDARARNG